MDKKWIQKKLKTFNALKTWQLLILLILNLFVVATALRLNNVGMNQRREQVIAADKALDDKRALAATIELANYVQHHMNSGGVIFNQATGEFKIQREVVVAWQEIYKRDFENAKSKAEADGNPNGNIFKKAEEACRPRFSGGYSPAYLNCILEEQNKYPSAENSAVKIDFPIAEKYNFRFISPLWTPDFAGWTIFVAGIIIFVIILKIFSTIILSLLLKKKFSKR